MPDGLDRPKTSQANVLAGGLRSKVEKITKWNSFKRRRASEVSKYIAVKKVRVSVEQLIALVRVAQSISKLLKDYVKNLGVNNRHLLRVKFAGRLGQAWKRRVSRYGETMSDLHRGKVRMALTFQAAWSSQQAEEQAFAILGRQVIARFLMFVKTTSRVRNVLWVQRTLGMRKRAAAARI